MEVFTGSFAGIANYPVYVGNIGGDRCVSGFFSGVGEDRQESGDKGIIEYIYFVYAGNADDGTVVADLHMDSGYL